MVLNWIWRLASEMGIGVNGVGRTVVGTVAFTMSLLCAPAAHAAAHLWEKQEVTLTAARTYDNPYTAVTVWVDLEGPHFRKRVYGFWDGGSTFRVRLVATEPGPWKWSSNSVPSDPGLGGKKGSFSAVAWTEKEKQENPLRSGFLRASENGHALE